ncbi:MAG: Sir2 silent information regulator family NAD-dependent deacetylase [Clostridia bacterium]|nr:Sir2 silent information regulator family NAD-dependent deacetylase [Clostridia bacterium]
MRISRGTGTPEENIKRLKKALSDSDAVVVGAGAGLSTSAGFVYAGERFEKYFGDFEKFYGFDNMYAGGFYPYDTAEEMWAFWSRNIYVNRYMNAPKPVYERLMALIRGKDYFVITTNVDHCFQKAGVDKDRLFYTQGDYGLWQCSKPCHKKTYDNEETVRKMVLSQGFSIAEDGTLTLPKDGALKMTVPSELLPRCPVCGEPMSMNLRADDTFVEDEGWHRAAERYAAFLERAENARVLYLELGVGQNTPVIIKYPFWRMTASNPRALYACLNFGESYCPKEIEDRSICIEGDSAEVIERLL